jgi:TetR/AcrR family transcriptional repressor of nem operon
MQERARVTRTRILECAADAFARDGYEGTSLNEVVRASGLTKGAFYFHFGSKEELALATFRHKQEQLLARTLAETGEQPDALSELAAVLRTRLRIFLEDPSARCVLRIGSELGAKAGPESEFAGFQELTISTFASIVERGQREGTMRSSLDPRATGEAIFAAVVGTDRVSRLLAGSSDIERRTDELLELLAHGLAASRAPGEVKLPPRAGRASDSSAMTNERESTT